MSSAPLASLMPLRSTPRSPATRNPPGAVITGAPVAEVLAPRSLAVPWTLSLEVLGDASESAR